MWNCLPLALFDRTEEEVRAPESSWRAESSMKTARLPSAGRKVDTDRVIPLSRDPAMKTEAPVSASDSLIIRSSVRRPALWFSYLVEYLGQTLLNYLAGVAEKMDKREYY